VIGGKITDHGDAPLEAAIRLSDAMKMPIIATAHSCKFLDEKGFKRYVEMGLVELTNVVVDEEWQGVDGYGRPDLVVVLGAHLDLMNALFQSLKTFTDIPTLSISRYFMINASFSLPNLDEELWIQSLQDLCEEVEKGRS
jgi:CO dehydrogenase/acetyl-CoA synthase complex epsilon subunit